MDLRPLDPPRGEVCEPKDQQEPLGRYLGQCFGGARKCQRQYQADDQGRGNYGCPCDAIDMAHQVVLSCSPRWAVDQRDEGHAEYGSTGAPPGCVLLDQH